MKSSERSFARRIDLTSLQLFVAVCELGSIGRAARATFTARAITGGIAATISATLTTRPTAISMHHGARIAATATRAAVEITLFARRIGG